MDSSFATTPATILSDVDTTQHHSNHSYATRIRQNIVIKPSARLRRPLDASLPSVRKHKQVKLRAISPVATSTSASTPWPSFPPPEVTLHQADATSKVFLAIGRAFTSVDNRAMTIKDLAEMCIHFGLVCQNVSAASQAITTYIRAHMDRCEDELDYPLLMRHTMSGISADDDLLPALYSRSGGAHCIANQEQRATNFRRGTTVWYLSKATGAECPFARAGIDLSDYGENGRRSQSYTSEKKKHKEKLRGEQCGEKRKRPTRSCVGNKADSDSDIDIPKPPSKVKLTLRLKPLVPRLSTTDSATSFHSRSPSGSTGVIDLTRQTESDDDEGSVTSSASGSGNDNQHPTQSEKKEEEEEEEEEEEKPWSLPPYPRRSISIPCYTPSQEHSFAFFHVPFYDSRPHYQRSPSLTCSIASLPPDSDDDEDLDFFTRGMRPQRDRRTPVTTDPDMDGDLDSEGGETMWESPGPRSPSAPLVPSGSEITVKEEPRNLQGMLDAWDYFDSNLAQARLMSDLAQTAANAFQGMPGVVKVEPQDVWDWDRDFGNWFRPGNSSEAFIKQEDYDLDLSFSPVGLSSSSSIASPHSNCTSPHDKPTTPLSQDNPILLSSFDATPIANCGWTSTIRSKSTSPSPSSPVPSSRQSLVLSAQSLASMIQSLSMSIPPSPPVETPPPCISPQQTRCDGRVQPEVVVVHTCQPCTPAITATQIEGISVYQMMLGSFALLRRIDTDFVNLTPIVAHSGAPYPVLSTIPNAVVVSRGSAMVTGTWVPLSAAQAYVKDHQLPEGSMDLFLSDSLFEKFPQALQDFHHSSAQERSLNQFGPHFGSTLQAAQLAVRVDSATSPPPQLHLDTLGQLQPSAYEATSYDNIYPAAVFNPPFGLMEETVNEANCEIEDTPPPLSAKEQEIFHEFCSNPEWDKEISTAHGASQDTITLDSLTGCPLGVLGDLEDAQEERDLNVQDVDGSSDNLQEQLDASGTPDLPPASPLTETSTLSSSGSPKLPTTEPLVTLPAPPPSEEVDPTPPRNSKSSSSGRTSRVERPLRRSKRVAEAIAARSRTRSRRRGSRNSLS